MRRSFARRASTPASSRRSTRRRLQLHQRLKAQFDPHRIFNRGRLFAELLMETAPGAFHPRHRPRAARPTRSCAPACIAASATATCPTYQLLGDELDGPRGRIYLIKQVLEGGAVTAKTQLHLDRCLTCRSCETTCPSGVQYGAPGRYRSQDRRRARRPHARRRRATIRVAQEPAVQTAVRRRAVGGAAGEVAFCRARSATGFRHCRACRRVAIAAPRADRIDCAKAACSRRSRRTSTPRRRACSDRIGISAIKATRGGCCGALSYHLSEHDERTRCHSPQHRRLVAACSAAVPKRSSSRRAVAA